MCNYFAFDIIGDLAFGAPFGMLDAAKDIAPVAIPSPGSELKTFHIPAVQILNSRADYSASGCASSVGTAVDQICALVCPGEPGRPAFGVAIAAVEKRLVDPGAGERGVLLSKLREGKDEDGNPVGRKR
jgi:benzoate 4-monooxygenase